MVIYTNNSSWSSETKVYSWPRGGGPTSKKKQLWGEKKKALNFNTQISIQQTSNTFEDKRSHTGTQTQGACVCVCVSGCWRSERFANLSPNPANISTVSMATISPCMSVESEKYQIVNWVRQKISQSSAVRSGLWDERVFWRIFVLLFLFFCK